uniref:Eukaryotic translation initiation factor 3 subunit M n=1 Tax=Strigamia maritima TaxID=126957 RepID=T1IX91_STRMM
MSVPAFIDITFEEFVAEIRSYFKSLGAEISEEASSDGIEKDLRQIIDICDTAFKESADSELEPVLNSIVSLLIMMPPDSCSENLVLSFCEKMTKTPNIRCAQISLRCLNNLFYGLNERSPLRYHIYFHMIKIAGQTENIKSIFSDLDRLKSWVNICGIGIEKLQILLRSLHEVLDACRQSDLASKVMIELLSTYTEDNAGQAGGDAHKCIVSSLGDPNTFLLDHLLALKPVKFLEGELIHDLLTIFVSDRLSAYLQFYEANKDFVQSLGLRHEGNVQKMRILTLMQMAENKKEIPYEQVQQELKLDAEAVESFVIEVVRTKMVRAKIDQLNNKVIVSSTVHRTFSKNQWQQLHEILKGWSGNLTHVETSMQTVLNMQYDQITGQV